MAEEVARRRRERLLNEAIPKRIPVDLYESEVLDPLENADFRVRPIDTEMVRRLASLYMTDEEIGVAIDLDIEKVRSIYGPIIEQGRQEALVALRRARWRSAMRGNTAMLIHLSEQLLGEKPSPKVNVNVNLDATDPRSKLLEAVREAAGRMEGREIAPALPMPRIAAGENEF